MDADTIHTDQKITHLKFKKPGSSLKLATGPFGPPESVKEPVYSLMMMLLGTAVFLQDGSL